MSPSASFLPRPAGSSHECLFPPLAPWGYQHLPPVPETNSKASWGFLRSFSARPARSPRQEDKWIKKGRTFPGNSEQSWDLGWKNRELDSVAPLGFESGSLSFSMVSGVPGLSFLPVTPMIVLPGPVRRRADEKTSQHPWWYCDWREAARAQRWDDGLTLLGKDGTVDSACWERAGMRGLAVEGKQTWTSWGGISGKNILITNKEKWEIYC